MTETYLRTRTLAIAYLAIALCFAALAIQNLRYGFYELFFSALVIMTLGLSGAVYTALKRRTQLQARGHLMLVVLTQLCGLWAFAVAPGTAVYWLFPLLILGLVLLPLAQG